MSRREKRPDALIAQQLVSSAIENFYESKKTPHGLPEDVLVHAFEGYGTEDLDWPLIRTKALNLAVRLAVSFDDRSPLYH